MWLGLPSGPWPPDHYALLGLSPGECDPAAVESLVLAGMDRLRPHQLLHPELVTVGMNRLAQALVCLTDPVARAAYDAAHGFSARNRSVASPATSAQPVAVLPDGPIVLDADLLLDQPPPTLPPEPTPAYEVVEPEPGEPRPPAYEVVWETEAARPAYEVVEVVEAELVALPHVPWHPASRRQLFARLAAVRRLLAAWRQLKPVLADPREPLTRPARVLALVEAVTEVRRQLGSLRELVGDERAGELVVTVVAQPLMLQTLRMLLPGQRRALALDWRSAEAALLREYARLRELVRSGRPVRRRSRGGWRVAGWLARTPEFVLVVLALAALLAAFLRDRGGQ
jgi:hypothetical protein